MQLTGHGGLDKLQYVTDYPTPRPDKGQALIRVHACGLNNTDINTRTAWYSKSVEEGITETAVQAGFAQSRETDASWSSSELLFPLVQGADICGTVERVEGCPDSSLVEQRVMIDPWLLDKNEPENLDKAQYLGSEVDGGYAEYVVAPVENVYPVNSDYSDAELATFGCAYTTAENLISRANLDNGEIIVISGASGGVGSAAIQLAKVRGATVIALSAPEKFDDVRRIGADYVVDRKHANLADEITRVAGRQVDVAADVVGGPLFDSLIDSLRRGGRYSSSGCIAGPMVNFDLRKLVYRDLQFSGATVVPSGTFARILSLIESKQIAPLLAAHYPLSELAQAQEMFMKKMHTGNIVVTVD